MATQALGINEDTNMAVKQVVKQSGQRIKTKDTTTTERKRY